jgi:hypothetical protein
MKVISREWHKTPVMIYTRFKSRGAHRCDEQWNTRGTRVYTGSDLHEDRNPTPCVRQLYYDCLGRDPIYPSFYRIRG